MTLTGKHHGDGVRSLRAVARVPRQTAECGCTTRATRRIAGPTANVPPAAKTGGESETTGSCPSARPPRPKTTGRAGREGARPRRKAITTTATATANKATLTRMRMRPSSCRTVPLGLLRLLKHGRVATSSALQAPPS